MRKTEKNVMEINVVLAAKSIKALAKELQPSKEVTLSEESVQALADAISDNIIFGMEMLLKPIYDVLKNISENTDRISF